MDRRGLLPEMPRSLRSYGESLSALIEGGFIRMSILPHYSLLGLVSIDRTAEYLSCMNWCLLRSSGPHYFLISDNPIAIYDQDFKHGARGIGLAYPNIEVTFPLDKCNCLFAAWKAIDRDVVDILPRSVREIK
jgi:hypothetical protein